MNIIIDYGFPNKVRDVNDNFTPGKILRNKKTVYIKFSIPLLATFNIALFKSEFFYHLPAGIVSYYFFDFHTHSPILLYNFNLF